VSGLFSAAAHHPKIPFPPVVTHWLVGCSQKRGVSLF
jgi:hypothetical protein